MLNTNIYHFSSYPYFYFDTELTLFAVSLTEIDFKLNVSITHPKYKIIHDSNA